MKSITKHLKPKDFAAQIRMERQKHKGAFFLMEGPTDIRRFKKFLHHAHVSIVSCYGKQNVIDTIRIEQESGTDDCLGFIDADFDRVANCVVADGDVIVSNKHDFDMDIISTGVMQRYLDEVSLPERLVAEGGSEKFITSLLEALKPLSALRYANEKHHLRYSLSDLKLEEFFNGYRVDVDALIEEVSQGRFASEAHRSALDSYIARYTTANLDLWQITNGHDFFEALGIALRNRISNRPAPQTWRKEIERHIRLSFDFLDFHACGMQDRILVWQNNWSKLDLLRLVV